MTAKPLVKTPVTYMPTNEPMSEAVLRDVARQLAPAEASPLAAALGISRPRVQVIERNAALRGSPAAVVSYEVLMMWVKALPKCADKVRQRPTLSTSHAIRPIPDMELGHILRPSDPVTRESSDPETQLTR